MIPTRRRLVGAAFALLALAPSASRIALSQARLVRIGFLGPLPISLYFPSVLKRLAELGYVEGKNLVVDYRSADGVVERFPTLARDLIRAKCDLIVAAGSDHPARALVEAKTDVPVVILAVDYDPVKAGIVSNLRRPGGNFTGMFLPQSTLATKRLQLLREVMPNAKRFLVLADSFSIEQLDAVRRAAEQLRVAIVIETFEAPPYALDSAFAKGHAAGTEAVVVLSSPVLYRLRSKISELAIKRRLPSISGQVLDAEADFLIGYGVPPDKAFIRAGDIAASILKGAKPGDIPVEQPTVFDFGVNLKTAKALGISIPPSIMLRANRVIE